MESVKELIEKRAYHLFLKRGGVHGYAHQDWVQAEKEIMAEMKKGDGKQPAKPATPAPAAPAARPKVAEIKPAPAARFIKKSR